MINPLENPEISRRELGQSLIEYAAIAAGLSIAGAAALGPVGNALGDKFGEAEKALGGKEEKPDEPTDWSKPAYCMIYDTGEIFEGSDIPAYEMIFQRGDEPEPGKTLINNYTGFEDSTQVPWRNNPPGAYIRSVKFKDEVKPISTFQWFWNMFQCEEIDLVKLNTSEVTNMYAMFSTFGGTKITSLDLSSFNTSKVTNMCGMFFDCSPTALNLSSFDTSSVTDMRAMFKNCSRLTSLDLSSFDTSKVTKMYSSTNGGMFDGCSRLTSLDLSSFDTSNITDMTSMFRGCKALRVLDVSSFDTSSVTGMYNMFYGCKTLTTLDVTRFDTSSVTNMSNMFYDCSGLIEMDLSSFNTASVTDMYGMFYGCSGLTSLDLSGFNTSNATRMNSMFSGCSELTSLDLSSFDTSSVTTMSYMFGYCSGLKIAKLGARFGFLGNATSGNYKCTLPGSTWKNAAGIEYAVKAIPNNVADTYTKVA